MSDSTVNKVELPIDDYCRLAFTQMRQDHGLDLSSVGEGRFPLDPDAAQALLGWLAEFPHATRDRMLALAKEGRLA